MADVAARAGVSHQTVSRVLNGSPMVRAETRARVLAAIELVGYRRNNAARMLATNRSGRIGLIAAHLDHYGPSMIAVSLQQAGHRAGYDVSLVGLPDLRGDALGSAVDRLLGESVEAMVVAVAQREAMTRTLDLDLDIPVVVVQGVSRDQPMAAGIDQTAGAELAVDHLWHLGHRRIAHVTGPLDWIEATQRRDGWCLGHEHRGARPGPEIVGDWTARSGYQAGLALGADPEVTAVVAANDAMALGVFRALHELGRRVPEEVSVVGFDDAPQSAYYWPGLTTVRQEFSRLGEAAVDLAVRSLRGESSPRVDLVVPELIVRASTALAVR